MARTMLFAVLILGAASPAAAQGPCDTDAHRAFDFWLGQWEVYDPSGTLRGTNEIRATLGGCVLHERYTTPGGYEGESFSIYDAPRGVWHQSWVDNGGLLLRIEGGLRGGAMVLEGATRGPGGEETWNRISWSRSDTTGVRVRQLWEVSADGGGTWTVAFDGEYRRVAR